MFFSLMYNIYEFKIVFEMHFALHICMECGVINIIVLRSLNNINLVTEHDKDMI